MTINEDGTISFMPDEQEDLERLAALRYSLKEMAMYFKIPFINFKTEANTEGSEINYHIERGKLTIKANADMRLLQSAEGGNITAAQQLAKVSKEKDYQDLLLQLEEPDDV